MAEIPGIPGVMLRRFQGAADFTQMAAVLTASQRADGYERQVTAEQIAASYQNPVNFDPYQDVILAETAGTIVAYGRVWWWDEGENTRLYGVNCFILPEQRSTGTGSAMLDWLVARIETIAALHPPARKYIQISLSETQNWLAQPLEQAGFQPVRYFFHMVRPNLDELSSPSLPAGLEVRPVAPEQYPAIWAAVTETSQEEWGEAPPTEDDYQEWLASPHFQPQRWQVAWDTSTGQVAGHVLTYIHYDENEQFKRKRGYTEGIGVVRDWRRRGVAQALIALSLKAQKDAGMSESALVVDSANASGATRLYEKCGFRVVGRDTVYRKII